MNENADRALEETDKGIKEALWKSQGGRRMCERKKKRPGGEEGAGGEKDLRTGVVSKKEAQVQKVVSKMGEQINCSL